MNTVYLIPALLQEDGLESIPPSVIQAVKECSVFFVENERTTRRYFKKLWKEMVIDDYEWHVINDTAEQQETFKKKLKENQTIGIVSEAGCPGVADPGQALVDTAHRMNATVKPLAGPSSVLLAIMASGMNGQQFRFHGYLPIDSHQRVKAIKELEAESAGKKCTQVFIETPYRNKQLIEALLMTCHPATKLCLAVDLTGKNEWIKTRTIQQWQKEIPEIHKRPAVFLLYGARGV
jgi:16S rRNA (cytidine1402-2'-O)-methyltransferase